MNEPDIDYIRLTHPLIDGYILELKFRELASADDAYKVVLVASLLMDWYYMTGEIL